MLIKRRESKRLIKGEEKIIYKGDIGNRSLYDLYKEGIRVIDLNEKRSSKDILDELIENSKKRMKAYEEWCKKSDEEKYEVFKNLDLSKLSQVANMNI